MRHHGFQAYAAAHYRDMYDQREAFPYWQYLTMGDERVRDSHAKLHGLILPADDPFWDDHYPPWDWNCRCQVVPVSEAEYRATIAAGRVPSQMDLTGDIVKDYGKKRLGWTLEKAGLKQLETIGRIDEGNGATFDVSSPVKRAQKESPSAARAAYQWRPGEVQIPVSELYKKYGLDPVQKSAFDVFYRNMQAATVAGNDGTERRAWDWLMEPDIKRAARRLQGRATSLKVDGESVENAFLVDYKSGKVIGRVSGTPHEVNPTAMLKKAAAKNRQVVLIHNHHAESIPSPQDVLTSFGNPKVVAGNGVVAPSGNVQIVRVSKDLSEMELAGLRAEVFNFNERLKLKTETPKSWELYFTRLFGKGAIEYEVAR
jgi:hypothetical protein